MASIEQMRQAFKNRIFWTSEQFDAVADGAIAYMRANNITIKWHLPRKFRLQECVMEGQKVLPKELQRPDNYALIEKVSKRMQKKLGIEAKQTPSSEPVLNPPAPVQTAPAPAVAQEIQSVQDVSLPPPFAPSRIGLDPRFGESCAYVLQTLVRTFAEELGHTLGREIGEASGSVFADSMRQVLRDIRFGMLSAPLPQPEQDEPRRNGEAVPDRPRQLTILIIGMLPDQQQHIARRFPRAKFLHLGTHTPAEQVEKVTRNCDCAFTGKFLSHSVVAKIKCKWVHVEGGAITGISRAIEKHFPQLAPTTAAEKRAFAPHGESARH